MWLASRGLLRRGALRAGWRGLASEGSSAEASVSSDGSHYDSIVTEVLDEGVGVLRLHRPKELNAFNSTMTREIVRALNNFQRDSTVAAVVVAGSEKAFAAGADIKEMASRSFVDQAFRHRAGDWIDDVTRFKKPLIAAVRGFALGGGCEFAMACDIVIASESAVFGQPEVTLGTIPGWGGTQRLIRAVGKAKAMEMILTGRRMSSAEAESAGLVSRVMPDDRTVDEAIDVAKTIAGYSRPVIEMAKDCINHAAEVHLSSGLKYERRSFHSTFALEDQREGMTAFVDKRSASWSNR